MTISVLEVTASPDFGKGKRAVGTTVLCRVVVVMEVFLTLGTTKDLMDLVLEEEPSGRARSIV